MALLETKRKSNRADERRPSLSSSWRQTSSQRNLIKVIVATVIMTMPYVIDWRAHADDQPLTDSTVQDVESRAEERPLVHNLQRAKKRLLEVLAAESGTDPTAIIGQLSPRTRYQNRSSDQRVQEIGRISLPLAADWLLRVDVPLTYLDPKNSSEKSVMGLGDIRARLGWRVYHGEDGAIFLGSEFYFPTATNPLLGSDYGSIGPAVVGSLKFPDIRSIAYLWVEYLVGVSGHLGGGFTSGLSTDEHSRSESRIRFRLNTLWTEKWWSFAESRLFVDWQQNGKTGMVLVFEGGRKLDHHWRLYGRPEVGLWGQDLPGAFNYGFEFGVRYMFYLF